MAITSVGARTSRRWAAGTLVLAAIVGSGIVAGVRSRARAPSPRAEADSIDQSEKPAAAAARPMFIPLADQRIPAIQRRLDDLEARASQREQSAGSPTPTPQESWARHLEEHCKALEAHEREPVDAAWARDEAAAVGGALKDVAEKGQFATREVDCRSSTCVATVEWPSARTAQRQWKTLLAPDYGPCTVEVMLDEPSDPAAPFQTKVVYDCSGRQ